MAKNCFFLHYMGLGRVWYGAKYCHGLWERFAHRFESFRKIWKIQTLSEPFLRCVVSPAGATHFQESDFSVPFLRCVVFLAGATHFQESDQSVGWGVWGYGILVPGAWHQVPGNLPGTRYLVPGTGYRVPGTWDRNKKYFFFRGCLIG